MGYCRPMGYGVQFPTHQVGGQLGLWDKRGYGLPGVWVKRGLTVIGVVPVGHPEGCCWSLVAAERHAAMGHL